MHIFGYTEYVDICVHIWISPMWEICICGASLDFSTGEIQAGTKNKDFSIGEIHIWMHICTYLDSMCMTACIYGFLWWRNPYFWHQFGFLQWRNPNWPKNIDLSIRKIHICNAIHLCIYLDTPNMCIYACIWFLGWGNPYCRYQFGFPHWRNTNRCQKIWNLNSWHLDSRK